MGFFSNLFGGNKEQKALQEALGYIRKILEDEEYQLDMLNPVMKEMIKSRPAYDRDPNGTGPFGFSATNPIPVNGPIGQLAYLSKLETNKGERVLFHRIGAIDTIDVFEAVTFSVLILKPSESFPTLTEGLIKGILYFANTVILGDLTDSRSRRFHILIDEFQSYGNIEAFTAPALSLYRSRGVSLSLAMQDLAQLVKIYGQEFVDFITANTGSMYILGVNDGFTANKFSELLGEKTIAKLHRSVSHSDGGKSTSVDEQHHQEKVMGANEFNLLGANEATLTITYLALFARQNPAYILTAPILSYKTRAESKPAAWIDAQPNSPVLPDMDRFWDVSHDSYQAPQPAISATQTMIDEQLDHLYDGYCDDLEKEFATQTDADRLGFIAEPGPFAMYQED